MSKAIPFDTIVEAVFEGAQKGIKKYHRMSGGYDVKNMPESYIQANIVTSLYEKKVPYVTMETTMSELVYNGGGKLSKKKNQSIRKRIDVVVWWKRKGPRVVIEIKRYVKGKKTCNIDADKLTKLLGSIESLNKGIVVACFSSQTKGHVENFIENIKESIGVGCDNRYSIINKYRGENWYYGVSCFIIPYCVQ